jgi:HTH-type transcriptional regulator, competence development regulator
MGQLRQQFAKRLKKLREQRSMTQEELANAAGLSISFIRSIEQGLNAPSFESMEGIAFALGVSVMELFDFGS